MLLLSIQNALPLGVAPCGHWFVVIRVRCREDMCRFLYRSNPCRIINVVFIIIRRIVVIITSIVVTITTIIVHLSHLMMAHAPWTARCVNQVIVRVVDHWSNRIKIRVHSRKVINGMG